MKRDLLISVTDKCNYQCSFCSASQEMSLRQTGLPEIQASLHKLREEVSDLGIVTYSGGEPLLAPSKLSSIIDTVDSLWGGQKNRLVTNGRYLSKTPKDLLDRFSTIIVGIDGYALSERPLSRFLEAGDYSFFERCAEYIDVVEFRQVVGRSQLTRLDWEDDVRRLHLALANLGRRVLFHITLDSYLTTPLSDYETDNFIRGFRELLAPATSVDITLDRVFGETLCDCRSQHVVSHTGDSRTASTLSSKLPYGCALLSNSIGPKSYERILNMIRELGNE